MRFLFKSRRSGYQYSQGRCNMAESTIRCHCFGYFGNHLDTMFLLIASMVSVTHNRRRISIKVVIVKKLFRKEEKYIFSLFQIAYQTFEKSNSAEVVFFSLQSLQLRCSRSICRILPRSRGRNRMH